ncbi:hypothetical protein DITRI_Ditri09bG0093000 [Diplodiscus trichospermus]
MLLCLDIFTHSFCNGIHNFTCIESEKQALLKFKYDLRHPSKMLANWSSNGDCCNWFGVVCDNATGHVNELHLGRSKLGGKLNLSLLRLKHLSQLDLSHNDFEQTQIPVWFWNFTSRLQYLNISGNQFQGKIPDLLITRHASVVLDFSSNNFTGPLPLISFNVTAVDVSNNAMSGSICHFLCHKKHHLMKLEVLNLSNNLFSGKLPDCWEEWQSLVAIKFCNNNFTGKIPSSMGSLTSLQSLHLRNNRLVGELPSSLRNCTELITVDFGFNQLSGEIPSWMGEKLSKLIIISLQTNTFHGHIPEEICSLSSLQILDLSHNNLSGNIPTCISSLTAMISRNKSDGKISFKTSKGCFFDDLSLVMKGALLNFSSTLKLIKLVDLSHNKLSGEIPGEVTNLIGLLSLNLSNNLLVGSIPDNIGAMRSLECVDLSVNNLSGKIPNGMSQLSFLSYLNLSYNNLTGEIPSGTQLQSFTKQSFLGTNLSGPPLNRFAKPAPPISSNSAGEKVNVGPKVDWFHLFIEFGFLFGFVGTAGPILFTRSWDFCIISFWNTLNVKFGT